MLIASLCLGATILQAQTPFFTEEFPGGLPEDWNAIEVVGDGTPNANWMWTNTGASGPLANQIDPLNSESASNGWMIFDSDANCSGAQDAWLVAPQFDFSDKEIVVLQFETFYWSFNDRPTIEVSTDSMNWESIEVFPEVIANDYGGEGREDNPQTVSIDLTDFVAGEPTVWIAFRFLADESTLNGGDDSFIGCGYAWQIDDVELFDVDNRPNNDLRIIPFYAVAPNYATPAAQVEEISFFAALINEGIQDQTGVTLNVEVVNQIDGETYTAEAPIGNFPSNTVIGDILFGNFTPPAEPNTLFSATYTLSGDAEDENPVDNTRSFQFLVTDTTFSKAPTGTFATGPADDNSYAWGNCYYVPNDGQFARYVTFVINNVAELIDRNVSILLYEWEGDLNRDFIANPDEYGGAPIAFNSYTITGDEIGATTVPVSVDEVGVPLEGDKYYFIVVQYDTDDNTPMQLVASDEIDYEATFFSTDSLGSTRYAGMLDVGNTGDFSVVGFGFDVVPIMRLHIGDSPDLTTSAINVLSPENVVEIFPNPARKQITTAIDLVNPQDITVQIFSLTGQLLFLQEYDNFKTGNLDFQTAALPAGTYFMKIQAEEGIRTKRFVVQK